MYVFNALVGSRLIVKPVLDLLIASLGVNLAVLASFGTIVAFFNVCTSSYPFMILLNVLVFALSGLLGLAFLLQTLHRITVTGTVPPPTAPPPAATATRPPDGGQGEADAGEIRPGGIGPDNVSDTGQGESPGQQDNVPMTQMVRRRKPGALDPLEGHVLGRQVKTIFRVWVCIFGLVGAQMGWVLRPFVGDPSLPFSWFRERESNFFLAVGESIRQLFGG